MLICNGHGFFGLILMETNHLIEIVGQQSGKMHFVSIFTIEVPDGNYGYVKASVNVIVDFERERQRNAFILPANERHMLSDPVYLRNKALAA